MESKVLPALIDPYLNRVAIYTKGKMSSGVHLLDRQPTDLVMPGQMILFWGLKQVAQTGKLRPIAMFVHTRRPIRVCFVV
ncbi:hypothetical protein ACX0G7_02135 [Flavitalea antarctica]